MPGDRLAANSTENVSAIVRYLKELKRPTL
jgi:hypothetical protein